MSDENERVVLVNARDEEIGTMPKLDAHRTGQLHRAFSVFIRNDEGKILLQRRADEKYHSGGLWTNACCGHPRPGEHVQTAAGRRLREEMGIECDLTEISAFTYRAELGNGLIEHEFDHVFSGEFAGTPIVSAREVREWQWISLNDLEDWVARDRSAFTVWFTDALEALLRSLRHDSIENLR
jgi:isopentenyl-diphosphate delta-isomerase